MNPESSVRDGQRWLKRDSGLSWPLSPIPTATGHKTPHPTLTHALVPLVVLHVALRTAAAVASEHVLAAVLAPMVSITLVHICSNITQTVVRQLLPVLWAARGAQGPRAHGARLAANILEGAHADGRFSCLIMSLQLGIE